MFQEPEYKPVKPVRLRITTGGHLPERVMDPGFVVRTHMIQNAEGVPYPWPSVRHIGTVPVGIGQFAELDIEAGLHMVEMVLPSGDVLRSCIQAADEECTADFRFPKYDNEAECVNPEWTAFPASWPFREKDIPDFSVPEKVGNMEPETRFYAVMRSCNGLHYALAVPPSSGDIPATVKMLRYPRPWPNSSGIKTEVICSVPESLLLYMEKNNLIAARVVVDELVPDENAWANLTVRMGAMGAAACCYVTLMTETKKTGCAWESRVLRLPELFPEMPDAWLIAAKWKLRFASSQEDVVMAGELLLRAYAAGLPFFSQGTEYMHACAYLLSGEDDKFREMERIMNRVIMRVMPDSLFTQVRLESSKNQASNTKKSK